MLKYTREFYKRIDAAKFACYDRLHPTVDVDSSPGARLLYDAVCKLWSYVAQNLPMRGAITASDLKAATAELGAAPVKQRTRRKK